MTKTKSSTFVAADPTATVRYTTVRSSIGDLLLVGDGYALTHLAMPTHEATIPSIGPDWRSDRRAFKEAANQLTAYFAGDLEEFDLPLAPTGTEFRMRVWNALDEIPYGQTASYGQIATATGNPKASRAVGMANHHNPIAIVIPCHRVVGSSGALTGYGGGLDRKTHLLALEGVLVD